MSVINKMLRDLDSRQSAPASAGSYGAMPSELTQGTVLVTPRKVVGRPGMGLRLTLLLVAVTLLVAGVLVVRGLQNSQVTPDRVAPQQTAPVVMSRPAVEAVAPVIQAPASAVVPPPAVVATRLVPAPVVLPPPITMPLTMQLKLATALKTQPTTPPPKAETPSPRVSLSPRQSPALDALAQAQSLWAAGSHAAALELLREAVVVAERASLVGSPLGAPTALASLARELARMEMADGHVSQALVLLTRLEPALSGEAEVWALRGNAAQRLGRHEESSEAYQRALRLRPNEARWMLGAAVSLAALGQTEPAAEFAERARAGGALSPEVAVYLKQLGVGLR